MIITEFPLQEIINTIIDGEQNAAKCFRILFESIKANEIGTTNLQMSIPKKTILTK